MDLNLGVLRDLKPLTLVSATAINDQTIELKFSEPIMMSADDMPSITLRYVSEGGKADVLTNGKMANFKGDITVNCDELCRVYEDKLESIFTCNIPVTMKAAPDLIKANKKADATVKAPSIKTQKVKAVIPVFPGTNCEYDTAKAMIAAGMEPEIIVINNLTPAGIAQSVDYVAKKISESQVVFIPGGFSGGDEPDGSGKFITAFFRNGAVKESVNELLKNRDGLMCGICNGFQAIIKLGLVPYGEIIDTDENSPTLTFNTIGRHQSKIVRTQIVSNNSPWLTLTKPGEIYNVPISHGEGRFYCSEEVAGALAANGQVATQYVDLCGKPTYDIAFNPNGSVYAIEGIMSADGHVLGKMGHSERIGKDLYKNVEGNYDMGIFKSAVKYFKV
jgi:phosphoribosylformylglycinamidine synthase